MNSQSVPRAGRALDLLGLLLFLAGAALYGRSWLGLRAMDEFERAPGDPTFAALEYADWLARIGRVGFGLMAAGAVVAVNAALVARRLARRSAVGE
ncbi:MAG TPA: hypothetical protein VMN78_10020 [Longimicrobiales bacterium]|nr:hypothetical protein [Longimicrobiales bacterium]